MPLLSLHQPPNPAESLEACVLLSCHLSPTGSQRLNSAGLAALSRSGGGGTESEVTGSNSQRALMSAPGWIEGARLCNSSQPTYFQLAYKTERRPCTQLLWWPQLPEKLGQVKLGQRRQEGFFQEGALVRRLMPGVEGDSRPRIEAHTGGGCRTRLGTHTGTEAEEAWVSQMGACLGYFSHALQCQALYLPSLSIPDPFFLV